MTNMMTDTPPDHTLFYTRESRRAISTFAAGNITVGVGLRLDSLRSVSELLNPNTNSHEL